MPQPKLFTNFVGKQFLTLLLNSYHRQMLPRVEETVFPAATYIFCHLNVNVFLCQTSISCFINFTFNLFLPCRN